MFQRMSWSSRWRQHCGSVSGWIDQPRDARAWVPKQPTVMAPWEHRLPGRSAKLTDALGWVQEQPTIMAPWERRWPDQLAKGTDVLA